MRHAFKLDQLLNRSRENHRTVIAARWMVAFTVCWWIAVQIAAGRIVWFW